jgi:putative Se/S carrier protein
LVKDNFYVIAFDSTHHAIKGEKILKEIELEIRTIPTPREITASCGLSIRFNGDDLSKVREVIGSNELSIKGIYEIIIEESGRSAHKIN